MSATARSLRNGVPFFRRRTARRCGPTSNRLPEPNQSRARTNAVGNTSRASTASHVTLVTTAEVSPRSRRIFPTATPDCAGRPRRSCHHRSTRSATNCSMRPSARQSPASRNGGWTGFMPACRSSITRNQIKTLSSRTSSGTTASRPTLRHGPSRRSHDLFWIRPSPLART